MQREKRDDNWFHTTKDENEGLFFISNFGVTSKESLW